MSGVLQSERFLTARWVEQRRSVSGFWFLDAGYLSCVGLVLFLYRLDEAVNLLPQGL